MPVSIRKIVLHEDSLDAVSSMESTELLKIWLQLPPEQQTPSGLWAVVDDYWRRKLVYVKDVGHPVTPQELFDQVQHWEAQYMCVAEQIAAMSRVANQLRSWPKIEIFNPMAAMTAKLQEQQELLSVGSAFARQIISQNESLLRSTAAQAYKFIETTDWQSPALAKAAIEQNDTIIDAMAALHNYGQLKGFVGQIGRTSDVLERVNQLWRLPNPNDWFPQIDWPQFDWYQIEERIRKQDEEVKQHLGIDWEKPETYKAYGDVPVAALYQAAEVIKDGRLPLDENDEVKLIIIQHLAKSLSREVQREIYRNLEARLNTKTNPGPDPMAPEEMIELVQHWRKTKLSQEKYCQIHSISRYSLQTAWKWYKINFGG